MLITFLFISFFCHNSLIFFCTSDSNYYQDVIRFKIFQALCPPTGYGFKRRNQMLSTKLKFISFAVVFLSAAAILLVYPNLKGESATPSIDDVKKELKMVKSEMESGSTSAAVIKRYGQLSNVLSKCNTFNQATEPTITAPFSPAANLCINGALAVADPTFNRMQTGTAGNGFSPGLTCTLSGSANAVHYDQYAFNLTGCAAFPTVVTMSLCGPAGCVAPANTDTVLVLYRNVAAGDPLTANGGLPAVFNPAAPCTNARGLNDDQEGNNVLTGGASCSQTVTSDCLPTCATFGAATLVSGMKKNLGNGRFTLVVTAFGNSTVGSYNLYIDAPAAGCAVALAPTSANATIGGRALTSTGQGISKATITLTGEGVGTIQARTNGFGYYSFGEVPVGTYVLTISDKRYTFAKSTRVITLEDSISDADFVSEQ
jgi:hypothetical protein